ncbi:GIY-YIG nuclease family protein [Echinicola sp. 20G]|uniref:GIY-YIG nuclease family protein n=1 Tax=Echinicola sp. 20G TaxID=2781961 RepID=UPI00191090F8|nr:GIY-YIG nuclease family protein [Echinicola sp. 20G]
MLPDNLSKIIDTVPSGITGVYFLMGDHDRIIYIGKSNDIRKRLYQHFSDTTRKSIRIQSQIVSVRYENTGNELIALLRESELIKAYTPIFNRAQRRSLFMWGLYQEEDENGYWGLKVKKILKDSREIMSFSSKSEGREYLFRITDRYRLCQKINGLYPTKGSCFQYALKTCNGACIQKEEVDTYNSRVKQYLEDVSLPCEDQIIILEGRNEDERGVVLVENGIYRGFGFFHRDQDLEKDIKSIIQPKTDNRDTQRLIRSYLRKQHRSAQSPKLP